MSLDALAFAASAGTAATQIGAGVGSFLNSRQWAQELKRRGRIAADEMRQEGAKLRGAQRAAYAASGVQGETGSPNEVMAAAAADAELNALRAQFAFQSQRQAVKQQGTTALIAEGLGAADTLIGGIKNLRNTRGVSTGGYKGPPRATLGGYP